MRKIEFRAWDKVNKIYYAWGEFNIHNNGLLGMYNGSIKRFSTGGNVILEQFTGLEDKNGEKIFEGDILEIPYNQCDSNTRIFFEVVHFRNGSFFSGSEHLCFVNMCGQVVGNVHENPELLVEK